MSEESLKDKTVKGVAWFITSLWLQLFVGGTIGILLYMGIAFCCKFSELNDVKYVLNRKA